MARYSDFNKEDLYNSMERYCTYDGGTIEDVAEVFNDFLRNYICNMVENIRSEMEEKYSGYKEKYEAMKKLIGE